MWRMSSGWMWRISDEDIYLRLAKKYFYVFLFVLIICRNMSLTSKNEQSEQIWS